jgi:predicted esterase
MEGRRRVYGEGAFPQGAVKMTTPANWHQENGFDYALYPAKTEKPESLIICLHGFGSIARISDNYLKAVQDKIPGADIINLQAPLEIRHAQIPEGQKGYTWFPLGGAIMPQVKMVLSQVFNRLAIAKKVEAFAHAELAKRGLTEGNLAYIGNSMGAIVALEAGLSGKNPVAAIVARGGTVLPFTRIKNKSGVFLQVGELDKMFNTPPGSQKKKFLKRAVARATRRLSLKHARAVQRLQNKEVPLSEKIYPGQGHMLDQTAWKDGVEFIAKALSQPKPPQP